MLYEKILTQENGDKLKVTLRLVNNFNSHRWDIRVLRCEKGKRKYIYAIDTSSYEYTKRPFPEGRDAYELEQIYALVPEHKILEIKEEYCKILLTL